MHERTTAAEPHRSGDDALAKLLQAEARLAERVAAARAAAEETLAQARADAERIENSCADAVAARCAELTARYEAQSAAELAELAASANAMAARFANVADDAIRGYLEFVIQRLIPLPSPERQT
jgi:vacuolar-type H+-ATPase subunit H